MKRATLLEVRPKSPRSDSSTNLVDHASRGGRYQRAPGEFGTDFRGELLGFATAMPIRAVSEPEPSLRGERSFLLRTQSENFLLSRDEGILFRLCLVLFRFYRIPILLTKSENVSFSQSYSSSSDPFAFLTSLRPQKPSPPPPSPPPSSPSPSPSNPSNPESSKQQGNSSSGRNRRSNKGGCRGTWTR